MQYDGSAETLYIVFCEVLISSPAFSNEYKKTVFTVFDILDSKFRAIKLVE